MFPRPFHRRLVAAAGAVLYVLAVAGLPLGHAFEHWREAHPAAAAQAVDVEALRDPRTGHVDLKRLAERLGLGEGRAAGHGHRHAGDPDAPGPLEHGRGSLEHFAVCVLAASAAGVLPVAPAAELPPVPQPPPSDPVPRQLFLKDQRSQAPPA